MRCWLDNWPLGPAGEHHARYLGTPDEGFVGLHDSSGRDTWRRPAHRPDDAARPTRDTGDSLVGRVDNAAVVPGFPRPSAAVERPIRTRSPPRDFQLINRTYL